MENEHPIPTKSDRAMHQIRAAYSTLELLVTTLESVHRIRVVAGLAIDAPVEAYARAEIERVTQYLAKATEALAR
jgi:transcriptional regulator